MGVLSILGGKSAIYVLGGIALALVVGAAALWLNHLVAENASLTAANAVQSTQLGELQAVNAEDQATLAAKAAADRRAIAALTQERDQALARSRRVQTIVKVIHDAPKADRDRLVGPVLSRALDWLRSQSVPGAPGGAGPPGQAGGADGALDHAAAAGASVGAR